VRKLDDTSVIFSDMCKRHAQLTGREHTQYWSSLKVVDEVIAESVLNFNLSLVARESYLAKGGNSRKKSKGQGTLTLKCIDEAVGCRSIPVTLSFMVGSLIRGSVENDFAQNCSVDCEEWNFKEQVDTTTKTFTVSVSLRINSPVCQKVEDCDAFVERSVVEGQ